MNDADLQRLLRAAAKATEEPPAEMPYGFDTRVIALSRRNGNGAVFGSLLRRITLAAAAVIIFASAGAYLEFAQSGDSTETFGNDYAIADSAIQDEVAQ